MQFRSLLLIAFMGLSSFASAENINDKDQYRVKQESFYRLIPLTNVGTQFNKGFVRLTQFEVTNPTLDTRDVFVIEAVGVSNFGDGKFRHALTSIEVQTGYTAFKLEKGQVFNLADEAGAAEPYYQAMLTESVAKEKIEAEFHIQSLTPVISRATLKVDIQGAELDLIQQIDQKAEVDFIDSGSTHVITGGFKSTGILPHLLSVVSMPDARSVYSAYRTFFVATRDLTSLHIEGYRPPDTTKFITDFKFSNQGLQVQPTSAQFEADESIYPEHHFSIKKTVLHLNFVDSAAVAHSDCHSGLQKKDGKK